MDEANDTTEEQSTTNQRRRQLLLSLGAAGIAGIAGCAGGGNNNQQTTSTSTPTETSTQTTTETKQTTKTTTGPEEGGTINYLEQSIAPTLDPHHPNGHGSAENYITYNTLVRYNQNLEFVPALATDWEVQDNGKTYVFQLRKGVKFHDGSDFNAEVARWNFERMLSDYSQVKSVFDVIDTVEASKQYELTFHLKKIFPVFLDNLSANSQMVSKQAVKRHNNKYIQDNPIGTGPFKMESWDKKKSILKFTAFDDYWEENKPYLDGWTMRGVASGQTRVSAFRENGNYIHGIPTKSVSQLKEDDAYEVHNVLGQSNTIDYLNFNTQKEPFSNKKLRTAVYYAINNERIRSFLTGTERIEGPLPKSNWGSNPDITVEHNLSKAKSLMAEAGMSDGFDIDLKIWKSDPQRRDLATITKQMLDKININVNVEVLSTSALIQDIFKGNYKFASLHWGGGGHLDPYGNLHVLFHSKGQYNMLTNYANDKVDTLLEEALQTTDREVRKRKYQQAEKIIFNDHPMIWFGRFVSYASTYDEVNGVQPIQPAGYFPRFQNVWIDQ
ncbi:MAG: ABC transporter substrate-binding protein [Halobacteriaceae archaeon]